MVAKFTYLLETIYLKKDWISLQELICHKTNKPILTKTLNRTEETTFTFDYEVVEEYSSCISK